MRWCVLCLSRAVYRITRDNGNLLANNDLAIWVKPVCPFHYADATKAVGVLCASAHHLRV